ncbi:MAG TPA: RAMP superfamily CRISPR-associated protein [Thermoanaerobaculia bacterium]
MARIEIVLQGHLLVAGGQAADLGVDLATARRFDGKEWVPYIPATAVRGAVRMQLEALLQARDGRAVSPYPEAPPAEDAVSNLFGYSGPRRRRDGAHEGALRFGDALPVDAQAARQTLAVRPGLEIDDQTASASTGKLYFREVADLGETPLVLTAPVATGDASADDLALLRAAVACTDAVGAGKSKGGGAVAMTWHDDGGALATTRVAGTAAGAGRAVLVLELAEPAHLGDGGPRGNHHATRTHIPGATVRGAVAWALLRGRRLEPDSPQFRALFLDEAVPVGFGDALLCPEGTDVQVAPATLRRLRGGERLDDLLVRELARERVNRRLAARGLYLRADDSTDRFDPVGARPTAGLVRGTRTRVSIDRWKGVAADERLFSIEQIEPWLAGRDRNAPRRPARFVSHLEWPAEGAAEALRGLEQLADLPLLVGAGRNHGLGQVRAELRFEAEPDPAPSRDRLLALGREVEREAAQLARRAGLGATAEPGEAPGTPGSPGADAATVPVALLAASDYVPSADAVTHPLAEPALGAADLAGAAPVRTFLRSDVSGGYDQIPGRPPLKALLLAVGAGSVFVYELTPERLAALAARLPVLRRGVGQRLGSGCGRFVPYSPAAEERP